MIGQNTILIVSPINISNLYLVNIQVSLTIKKPIIIPMIIYKLNDIQNIISINLVESSGNAPLPQEWRNEGESNSHRVSHRVCLANRSNKPIFGFIPFKSVPNIFLRDHKYLVHQLYNTRLVQHNNIWDRFS